MKKYRFTFLLFQFLTLCSCEFATEKLEIKPLQQKKSKIITANILSSTTTLSSNGPGNTYELIDSVFGPSSEDLPDCGHTSFGRHIVEVFDNTLSQNVFVFYAHVNDDDDRCISSDKQRTEIKTHWLSSSNLRASNGDTVIYNWKFKIDLGFKPSPSFTNLHQIMAGNGDNAHPIFTLTPRYNSGGDKMEIVYMNSSGTITKPKIVGLVGFKGHWVSVTETVVYGSTGSYSININRISDNVNLLSYTNNNIEIFRLGTTWYRPKWGIYRGLADSSYLRDEEVRFADFSITKF
ncbi:hypothetical protein [Pedobacter sp. JY14-1]|uniref:hypothetical protein n=1 Tax=Pedobacter sp. JY14-1 TaxID=3034151 RepID=UPI0023E09028|nr:hypothetical protein [Pedobacter sp. JY14-1]